MRSTAVFASIALVFAQAVGVGAEDIRIIAPYAGSLTNAVDVKNIGEVKDSGLLTGLYFQWIQPDAYQWNAFAYYAPDVNYSKVIGGHFIYDRYFGSAPGGKFVAGIGMEALRVEMDAGDALGTQDFDMTTSIFIPYLRTGKFFRTRIGPAALSALPWVGIQPEWVWGDMVIRVFVPFPPPGATQEVSESLDDFTFYGTAGLNLKATLFHFVDLEGKYQATFNASGRYDIFNATVNLFLSRNWGLSYRFKDMTSSHGSNRFHYFGVSYVF
jgi:hypothetical protein